MNKKLLTALNHFVSRLEKTEKFVLEQAPQLAREIVIKARIENYARIVESIGQLVVVLVIWFCGLYFLLTHTPVSFLNAEDMNLIAGFISLISCAPAFLLITAILERFSVALQNILKTKHTPKLVVLRGLRNLIREHSNE